MPERKQKTKGLSQWERPFAFVRRSYRITGDDATAQIVLLQWSISITSLFYDSQYIMPQNAPVVKSGHSGQPHLELTLPDSSF